MKHYHYMQVALSLAKAGIGTTAPNPSVGCVIVKDGQIIGQGATARSGRPHAETIALQQAGASAKGATAYVTLEPCCHTGQTPPCTDSLIKAEVSCVIIALEDPFDKVNGGGIKKLQDAGIEVICGICEDEARQINEGFLTVQAKNRPFITLKLATSLDGKIATSTRQSKWITCEESRKYSHHIRAKSDAILVGIETVISDDPELTCRISGMENQSPIRVIMDSKLRIPLDNKLVKTANNIPTWVLTTDQSQKQAELEQSGIKIINCKADDDKRVDINDAMEKLAQLGITRLMVEGGSKVTTSFIKNNLVDELVWMRAPIIIGDDGIAAISDLKIHNLADVKKLQLFSSEQVGSDTVEIYKSL